MSLLDDIKAAVSLPGPPCALVKAADSPHYDELCVAIRDRSVAAATIARVLTNPKYGLEGITTNTISRHRNNSCACCKVKGVTW